MVAACFFIQAGIDVMREGLRPAEHGAVSTHRPQLCGYRMLSFDYCRHRLISRQKSGSQADSNIIISARTEGKVFYLIQNYLDTCRHNSKEKRPRHTVSCHSRVMCWHQAFIKEPKRQPLKRVRVCLSGPNMTVTIKAFLRSLKKGFLVICVSFNI